MSPRSSLYLPRFLGAAALLLGIAHVLSSSRLGAWTLNKLLGGPSSRAASSSSNESDDQAAEWQYEIIMDAGSSGTRVHVYQYTIGKGEVLPRIQHPEATLKQEPGLSILEPGQVEEHLRPLLEFAKANVPGGAQATTPVVLLATAGLRLLPEEKADALLSSVRAALKQSPFESRPGWTGMLSGQDEGLFSWLAASYGSGVLQRRIQERERPSSSSSSSAAAVLAAPDPTSSAAVGVVELGGASAQVTFEHHAVGGCVVHVKGELIGSLDLPGIDGSLVTNSFLGFGLDVAQQQVAQMLKRESRLSEAARGGSKGSIRRREGEAEAGAGAHGRHLPDEEAPFTNKMTRDPCMPNGWEDPEGLVVGSGNFSGCLELAQKVMRGACEDHTCTISGVMDPMHAASGGLVEEGVTLPRFRGKILAVENFFYTSSILGLPDEPTLAEVEEAGQRYCSTPWEELVEAYVGTGRVRHEKELLKYCFSAAYIVVFLHNGLGVGREERRVRFTNSVTDLQGQEVPVRWALGALVMRAAERTRRVDMSLLEYIQKEVRGIMSNAAEGWGLQEQLNGSPSGAASGTPHAEEAAVVFSCGPEFCCAVASVPDEA